MAIGANVSKLSRELGVSRKGLYQWQKQFRVGEPSALRPRCAEAAGLQAKDPAVPAPSDSSDELPNALARIAELERMIGQQAVDLDFFQQALQHVGENAKRAACLGNGVYTVIQAMMASGLQGVTGSSECAGSRA